MGSSKIVTFTGVLLGIRKRPRTRISEEAKREAEMSRVGWILRISHSELHKLYYETNALFSRNR